MPLNVQVGADVSQFQAAMKQVATTAQTASNEVSKSLSDAAMQTDKLGGAALSSSQKMMQMRSGISAARDGVLAFTVGGQAAERSLLAMGHHFNSLVNETGSFKGALGALTSSLWGPGGIILGLSLAVELFIKWKDNQKAATQSQTDFQKALESNVKTASDELAHLMALYQASQNDALSRKQRLEAVRELQKEYPAYFGNMSKEAILAGDAAGAYDRLTNSIIASAAAKAGQEALAEQIKPLIQLQAALQNEERVADENWARQKRRYAEQKSAADEAAKKNQIPGVTTGTPTPNTPGFRTPDLSGPSRHMAQNYGYITDEKTGETQSLDDYKKEITNKIKDNAAAIQGLLEQYGIGTLLKNQGLKDEKEKKIKEPLEGLALLQKELKDAETALENSIIAGKTKPDDFDSPLVRKVKAAQGAIEKFKLDMQTIQDGLGFGNTTNKDSIRNVKTEQTPIGNTDDLANMQKQVKLFKEYTDLKISSRANEKEYTEEMKRQAKAGLEVARVFGQGLMSAFQEALSGTASFVQAMGQFLLQLIEKLIAAAAAAAILAVLLKATGFGAALGGAGSFSSLFGSLSGLSAIVPQHASGGIFTQAHVGMFGEAGPEAIVTPKHLQDFAGISGGGSQKVQIEPFQIGPEMWFRQTSRTNKRIGRTS